ncbi:hypothetical protein [Vibrio panuliri]|uniref:Uncharacterized protein n=1 Tax=Vibrio panuliri TaxID=1381081 RepID=A0ABX3FFJ8_9VIBR|nr:hypothetical protein [Vibrio panuliri]KAB1460872.1 hypothetical protein F7O85_00410 [Vibrio panuliri]OLQ91677.1 hypothetical protein BIY20_09750 [Vibrio panuliri]
MQNSEIKTLWAWVATESDGTEGIIAGIMPTGMTPLVTGNPKLLPIMEKHAANVAQVTGLEVKLVKFSGVEVINTLGKKTTH